MKLSRSFCGQGSEVSYCEDERVPGSRGLANLLCIVPKVKGEHFAYKYHPTLSLSPPIIAPCQHRNAITVAEHIKVDVGQARLAFKVSSN